MSSSCVTWPAAAAEENMTSYGRVPEIQVWEAAEETTTTPTEAGVRSTLSVCGLVAATNIVERCCRPRPTSSRSLSTGCLVVVDVQSPSSSDDHQGSTCSLQSLSNSELSLQSAVCNSITDNDTGLCTEDDAVYSAPSASVGRRRRFGRMLSRLTVINRLQTAAAAAGKSKEREPAQRCLSWSEPCSRRVAIDSSLSVDCCSSERRGRRRRRARADDDWSDVINDVDNDVRAVQQFATLLTSTDVRDGAFTARLPVDAMPHGDVMIRMGSGCLQVLQTDVNAQQHLRRRLCGVLELPMYVDSDSVTVRHDALQQCLVIEAATKGCCRPAGLRRRSRSLDEEPWMWSRGRKVAHDLAARLSPRPWRRRERSQTVVLCTETRLALTDSGADD